MEVGTSANSFNLSKKIYDNLKLKLKKNHC